MKHKRRIDWVKLKRQWPGTLEKLEEIKWLIEWQSNQIKIQQDVITRVLEAMKQHTAELELLRRHDNQIGTINHRLELHEI